MLVILSGVSGAGKDTIKKELPIVVVLIRKRQNFQKIKKIQKINLLILKGKNQM